MKELYMKAWGLFHPQDAFQAWLLGIVAISIVVGALVKLFWGEKFWKSAMVMLGFTLVLTAIYYVSLPIKALLIAILVFSISTQFIKDFKWHKRIILALAVIVVGVTVYYIWFR